MNKYIKLLAFSKELNPFLVLYQALNVLLKDSIKLLFVSLDIGYTGICLVFVNTVAAASLYEGNLSVMKLVGSPQVLASFINV